METRKSDLKETLSKYRNKGSRISIEEIKKDLSNVMNFIDYSTIPILFEFLTYLRTKNINNDLLYELENFRPDNVVNILEKYHSSNRSMLVLLAKNMLDLNGHNLQIIFEHKPFSNLLNFPMIVTAKQGSNANEWQEAKDALHSNTGIIGSCSTKNNPDQIFVVSPDFQKKEIINEYSSRQSFEQDFEYANIGQIEVTDDPLSYIKTLIRVTLIPVILKGSTKETLQINLIDGTINVINLIDDTFPKNHNGSSSFNLLDILNNADKMIDITISGITKKANGIEAFNYIIDKYVSNFNLPLDFKENLLYLMRNRTQFFEEIFLFPASKIINLWPDYLKVKEIEKKVSAIYHKTNSNDQNELEEEKNNADHVLDQGIHEMLKGNREESLSHYKNAEEKYNHVMQLCLQSQYVPGDIIADENPLSL